MTPFDVQNEILKLKKPPLKLSEYGFFKDMRSQLPSQDVLPYTLESALFSDYADKLRFIYLPDKVHPTVFGSELSAWYATSSQ